MKVKKNPDIGIIREATLKKDKGILYLIPSTLGDASFDKLFPAYNFHVIKKINDFIVEDMRTARRFLKKIDRDIHIDSMHFQILNEHTDAGQVFHYLDPIVEGKDIGLLSEAGTPCIADPGAMIVSMAHRKNIQVIPLTGPNSILLALMASGFNGQNFVFHGYLPIRKKERNSKLREIEKKSFQLNQTQIFIEAPYRNMQLLETILQACDDNTLLCLACDVTLPGEFIKSMTIKEWKVQIPDIHKRPTVFLLFK